MARWPDQADILTFLNQLSSDNNVSDCAPKPMEGHSRLRPGLRLLGLDLSRYRHRGRADSSGHDVRGAFLNCRHPDARVLCPDRTPHSFFMAATSRSLTLS